MGPAQAGRSGPTALYRLYDRAGVLLYVGITNRPELRFKQHAADKPWWGDVSRKAIRTYRKRSHAERAEIHAIRAERPMYNIAHNGSNPHRVSYLRTKIRRGSVRRAPESRRWPWEWSVTPVIVFGLCTGAGDGWDPGPVWWAGMVGIAAWSIRAGWKRAFRGR